MKQFGEYLRMTALSDLAVLMAVSATAQVRIVHKGEMTGCFITGHADGTAAEREALDVAEHFLVGDAPTKTNPWAKAIRKGDIVLYETEDEAVGEDGYRLVIDKKNVQIIGHGKGLVYGTVEFLKNQVGIDYWGNGEPPSGRMWTCSFMTPPFHTSTIFSGLS